jgi:trehalose 6-phosphate phosphatase
LDGALALLSGRSLVELDRLTAPLKLPASGLHGGEFRANGCQTVPPHLPAGLLAGVRAVVENFPGCSVEDKLATVAVHYRAAPGGAPALRTALLALLATSGHGGLEVAQGDHVFEIKPQYFDKGAALRRFMRKAPFAGRRPVFIADHPIDNAGFEAASGLGGVGFAVGQKLPGTAGFFKNPAALRGWLRDLAA